MACPHCGAPGGGTSGCGSCGLGINPNVGGAFNTGRTHSSHGGGSGGSDCFPADTRVMTPRGWERIEQLDKGDTVIGLTADGLLAPSTIKRKVSHKRYGSLLHVRSHTISLSFYVTRGHPVLTKRGWIAAKALRRGDELIYVNQHGTQSSHRIEEVVQSDRNEPVYNLIVDNDATFVANGCIAHSFVRARQMRVFLNTCWRMLSEAALRTPNEAA